MRMDRSEAHLDNAKVRHLASFIYRDLGYPFYPVLNGVCNVGDDLAIMTLYQDIGLVNPGRTDSPALFAPDNLPDALESIILRGMEWKLSIQRTSLSITC